MNTNQIINWISRAAILSIIGVIALKAIIIYKSIDRSAKVHFNTVEEDYYSYLNSKEIDDYLYEEAPDEYTTISIPQYDTLAVRYQDQKFLLVPQVKDIGIRVSDTDSLLRHFWEDEYIELVIMDENIENLYDRQTICCFPMPDDFFVRQFSDRELELGEVFKTYLPNGKWVVNE